MVIRNPELPVPVLRQPIRGRAFRGGERRCYGQPHEGALETRGQRGNFELGGRRGEGEEKNCKFLAKREKTKRGEAVAFPQA